MIHQSVVAEKSTLSVYSIPTLQQQQQQISENREHWGHYVPVWLLFCLQIDLFRPANLFFFFIVLFILFCFYVF